MSATANGKTVTYRFADGSTFTKHGNHPNRDNNPLDLRSGPVTKANGAIGKDKGFGIFPNSDTGIKAAVINMDRLNRNPPFNGKATLAQLITKWSPKEDHNDTAKMIRMIPSAAGLKSDDLWSNLTPVKKEQFVHEYGKYEGFRF